MKKIFPLILLFLAVACSPASLLTSGRWNTTWSVQSDIAYAAGEGHTLDIYRPVTPAAGHPVMVFFYGGEWKYGSKEDVRFAAEPLAASGITVVLPDYRLYPDTTFPGFIDDGAAAVAWTHAHIGDFNGNPKNIFVAGHSAGAYIAAMLALNPQYLAKVGIKPGDLAGMIGLAGPYNFLPITWPELKPIFEVVPDLAVTQPITFVDGSNPPMLLLAGKSDETVDPQKNTVALYNKIVAAGGPVGERLYDDTGHVGIVLDLVSWLEQAPVIYDIMAFVKANIRR